jgi:hypothetical protein
MTTLSKAYEAVMQTFCVMAKIHFEAPWRAKQRIC